MRFVLFGNTYQTKKASHIERLLNTLRRLDCNLFIDASFYHFVKQELGLPFEPNGIFENGDFQADLAISMGGDGTFLKAASRIGNKDIPIVGINTGRLGFLADIMPEEIESAFDRYLMLRDEKDPFATDTTAHIVNDGDTRSVAAAYFGTDEKKAGKAIKSFIYYNRLMRTRNRAGRALISMSLKVSGMWENMHGMILPLSDNEIYSDGIAGLDSAYFRAITKAKELIENLKSYLEGKGELSPLLDRNFE